MINTNAINCLQRFQYVNYRLAMNPLNKYNDRDTKSFRSGKWDKICGSSSNHGFFLDGRIVQRGQDYFIPVKMLRY